MWFIIKWWLIKLRWDKLGFGRKGLSISPIRRSNIEEDKCFGINQSELERELFCLWRSTLVCQMAPQFLCKGTQLLILDPLIHTFLTEPLPPTFAIITMLKYACPFIVKLTPPLLLHATLFHTYDIIYKLILLISNN